MSMAHVTQDDCDTIAREAQFTAEEEASLPDPGGVLCAIAGKPSGERCVAIQT